MHDIFWCCLHVRGEAQFRICVWNCGIQLPSWKRWSVRTSHPTAMSKDGSMWHVIALDWEVWVKCELIHWASLYEMCHCGQLLCGTTRYEDIVPWAQSRRLDSLLFARALDAHTMTL